MLHRVTILAEQLVTMVQKVEQQKSWMTPDFAIRTHRVSNVPSTNNFIKSFLRKNFCFNFQDHNSPLIYLRNYWLRNFSWKEKVCRMCDVGPIWHTPTDFGCVNKQTVLHTVQSIKKMYLHLLYLPVEYFDIKWKMKEWRSSSNHVLLGCWLSRKSMRFLYDQLTAQCYQT